MKRIIRLTESDLTRIVKRVLREDEESKNTPNKEKFTGCKTKTMTQISNEIKDNKIKVQGFNFASFIEGPSIGVDMESKTKTYSVNIEYNGNWTLYKSNKNGTGTGVTGANGKWECSLNTDGTLKTIKLTKDGTTYDVSKYASL